MQHTTSGQSSTELHLAYTEMQKEDRPPRQREAAARLGVSEAQLVASQCGSGATRLKQEWLAIIEMAETIGTVMALTRNEYIVIEKDGVYGNVKGSPHVASVINGTIDLRLFTSRWASGFAVTEDTTKGAKRSLQFFDSSGTAVHKIHLRPASDWKAFDNLVRTFRSDEQDTAQKVSPVEVKKTVEDSKVDIESYHRDWDAMTDTHQFFGIVLKHKLGRLQALRLAGETRARKVPSDALHIILEYISKTELEFLIFVRSHGCIQIHTGPAKRIVAAGGWLNVLDTGFNLHVREEGLSQAWVVHKPSDEGTISGVEFFSPEGDDIALVFVNRRAGKDHETRWKALLKTL